MTLTKKTNKKTMLTLFLFRFFYSRTGSSPLLQFRWWYQTGRTCRIIFSRLPPMVVIFTYNLKVLLWIKEAVFFVVVVIYLKYITSFKCYSGLSARYQIIFQWIIVELRPYKYLKIANYCLIYCAKQTHS